MALGHVQAARAALRAMRGELSAMLAAHQELRGDPHWQAACAQIRALGDRLTRAADELEPQVPAEPPDAEEAREAVRETMWANR